MRPWSTRRHPSMRCSNITLLGLFAIPITITISRRFDNCVAITIGYTDFTAGDFKIMPCLRSSHGHLSHGSQPARMNKCNLIYYEEIYLLGPIQGSHSGEPLTTLGAP